MSRRTGPATIPIYRASKSLKVSYRFSTAADHIACCELPASDTHALLRYSVEQLLEMRSGLKHGTGCNVYPTAFDAGNIATASVTLLYADTTPDEGYLGEEALSYQFYLDSQQAAERIVCAQTYYGETYEQPHVTASKAKRSISFNDLLEQRVTAFSSVVQQYDSVGRGIATKAALDLKIADSQFHETFHHSEQAIMHLLSSSLGMQLLADAATSKNTAYLYGIVLDIYTQRVLCINCNIGLVGMQHSNDHGFLHNLGKKLDVAEHRIQHPDKLMLQSRVSASRACQGATMEVFDLVDDGDVVHTYNPAISNNVLQANTLHLGTKGCIARGECHFSDYNGAFFTAKHVTSKKQLEVAIKPIGGAAGR